jgi:transcriptional regulator with XRE-family HTH domain
MTGRTPWRDLNHKATPDEVERARAELDDALTLAELRRARELTQTQLAEVLATTQPGVSAVERRTDLYVSTLRSYIEALGGQLEITAVFPDRSIPIRSFTELGERTIEYGVHSYDVDSGIVNVIWRNLRERHDRGEEAAGLLAEKFDALATGRISALHIEPGHEARTLYGVIRVMEPPSGRKNPPFARLSTALEAEVGTATAS